MKKRRNQSTIKRVKKDQERFLEALEKSMGLVVHASDSCGISRTTHYIWMQKYPEYAERVRTITERNLDLAESVLLKAVKNEDLTAVFFYLNNKGKSRGYNVKEPNDDEGRKIEVIIKSPLSQQQENILELE
ncbi:MAG: hypothetical protein RMJ44_12510 [Cytophagales bacterium]|nr:hypothetical protein [Bacteroidia bacterium]MDW8211897.1 hypothetical protein [Cytophagales bacterium]